MPWPSRHRRCVGRTGFECVHGVRAPASPEQSCPGGGIGGGHPGPLRNSRARPRPRPRNVRQPRPRLRRARPGPGALQRRRGALSGRRGGDGGGGGHAANVCAPRLGGGTGWGDAADGRITVIALPVPDDLAWVVLVPTSSASTTETRAVLPASVAHADAVFNVQRVPLLLAGLQAKRNDALAAALDDRLHQPYRRALFPWMA